MLFNIFSWNHDTLQSINQSINQYYCLQMFEWCISDTRLHASVHSWFGLSDQNALMKVINDWQQLCWRYYPLSCYTHPFQHWLGLIWLEFSLHPASDLIWRHDLWPSIVFGLICFGFLLFFPLRKLWALFSSCFINLISDLKWNLW